MLPNDMNRRSQMQKNAHPALSKKDIAEDRRAIMKRMQSHRKTNRRDRDENESEYYNYEKEESHLKADKDPGDDVEDGNVSLYEALIDDTKSQHSSIHSQSQLNSQAQRSHQPRSSNSNSPSPPSPSGRQSPEENGYSQSPLPIDSMHYSDPFDKKVLSIIYIISVISLLFAYVLYLESSKLAGYI